MLSHQIWGLTAFTPCSEAPKQIRHSQSLELVFCQKCFVDTTKNSSGFLHVLLNPLEPSCGEPPDLRGESSPKSPKSAKVFHRGDWVVFLWGAMELKGKHGNTIFKKSWMKLVSFSNKNPMAQDGPRSCWM